MKNLWIATLLLFLLACHSAREGGEASYALEEAPVTEKAIAPDADLRFSANEVTEEVEAYSIADGSVIQYDLVSKPKKAEPVRKLIYQANLSIEVEDHKQAYAGVQELVAKYGGYISEDQFQTSSYNHHRLLVIRVPVEQYFALLTDLEGVAAKVKEKQAYASDVTEEWVDIEARLKNKRAAEERYLEILKKAKTIEEILQVEDKLRRVREEIEAKEGRLKYLRDRVAISTIRLTIDQPIEYSYEPEERPGFFARLLTSLDHGWSGLLSFILGLSTLWPLWIIIALIVYGIRRYIKSRKKKN